VTGCYDCGLDYGTDGWVDAVVPDEFWLAISPTGHGGGILCIDCMARRLANLRLRGVPVRLESGPFRHGTDCPSLWRRLFWRITNHLFMRQRLRRRHLDVDFYTDWDDGHGRTAMRK